MADLTGIMAQAFHTTDPLSHLLLSSPGTVDVRYVQIQSTCPRLQLPLDVLECYKSCGLHRLEFLSCDSHPTGHAG